jgi:superfamily II DNA or RNA helicase
VTPQLAPDVDSMIADAVEVFGAEVLPTPPVPPRTPPVLRDYQHEAVERLEAELAADRNPLLVAPTGSGKTVVLAALIRRLLSRGQRLVFLAPRRELIAQTSQKLDDVDVDHGVIPAGADPRAGLDCPVQVASVDTLFARVKRLRRLVLPTFDVAIVDEAHLYVTKARAELVQEIARRRIGATATPSRMDGKALGTLFDVIVETATTASLTAAGWLAPATYFSWPPNLHGLRTIAGDYHLGDLEARMNQARLVADIVATWMERAANRPTVVFATSIAHAHALADEFRRIGVAAEAVDAKTPAAERAAIFARFRSGATRVLTNCFLISLGFDHPPVSCLVLARPTKSLVLHLQMLGRALRPSPGKSEALILDHAGNVLEHGFATEERAWTLAGKYALDAAATREREPAKPKVCPACHATFAGAMQCPECGYDLRPPKRMVPTLDGELVEVGSDVHFRDLARRDLLRETAERRQFYRELKGIVSEKNYKPGFAAAKFRERYGDWPPYAWQLDQAVAPSLATSRWVKSRAIAWAKSQQGGTA